MARSVVILDAARASLTKETTVREIRIVEVITWHDVLDDDLASSALTRVRAS
jgi:hypothetical protein